MSQFPIPTGIQFDGNNTLLFKFNAEDNLKFLELFWDINPHQLGYYKVLFFLYNNLNRNSLDLMMKIITRQPQLIIPLYDYLVDHDMYNVIANYEISNNQLGVELYIFMLHIESENKFNCIQRDGLLYASIRGGHIPLTQTLLSGVSINEILPNLHNRKFMDKIGKAIAKTTSTDMLDFLISRGIFAPESNVCIQSDEGLFDQILINIKYLMLMCPDVTPNTLIKFNNMIAPLWSVPIFMNDLDWFDSMVEKGANLKVKTREGGYFYNVFWTDKNIKDVRFYERFALLGIDINYVVIETRQIYKNIKHSRQAAIPLSHIHLIPHETWFTDEETLDDEISTGHIVKNRCLCAIPKTVKRIEKFFRDVEVLLNVGYNPALITSDDPIFQIFLKQNIDQIPSFQSLTLQTIRRNNVDIQKLPRSLQINNIKLDYGNFRLTLDDK